MCLKDFGIWIIFWKRNMCVDMGQDLFLEQWVSNFHVLYSYQKEKRFKWTPTFAEHVYTNHLLQHYDCTDISHYTEKWNAKEGDKASTNIEIFIFSHSSVVGPVYALCYLSICLETALDRVCTTWSGGCSKQTFPTLSCFLSLQEDNLL